MSSTTTIQPSPSTASSPSALTEPRRRFTIPRIIASAVATAVAVNLAVWAVGALAGGSFEFTDGDEVVSAAPGGVVFLTAVSMTVGLGLAALVARRSDRLTRVAQVVGSVLAIGTIGMTLSADFDTASTITLSLTHVTLVPIIVVSLELIRSGDVHVDRPIV